MLEKMPLNSGAALMLRTMAARGGMNLTSACLELIDNSLDAAGRKVKVVYDSPRDTFTIEDDGSGSDDPRRMATPYDHGDHKTTRSGMYGYGGTAAYVYLCNAMGAIEIDTVTKKNRWYLVADFGQMTPTPDATGHDQITCEFTAGPGREPLLIIPDEMARRGPASRAGAGC